MANNSNNKLIVGILFSLAASLLWSTAGLLIKLVPWNAVVLAGWRGLSGAVLLLAFMLLTKRKIIINKRSIVIGIMVALTSLLFVSANKLTTAANAIVLQYTAPIFMIVAGLLFYKKRYKLRDYLAVAFTMAGIVLFFIDKLTLGGMFGNALALVDGICLALVYTLTGENDENARLSGILLGGLFTFIVGGPVTFFVETPVSWLIVLAVFVMGLVQVALPYMFYNFALRSCPPLAFALIGSIEIILNPVWVLIFVGERPGLWALIGSVVIIVTITVWCALGANKQPEPEAGEA